MNKIEISLDYPVKVGGKALSVLEMREPTMADEEDSMDMAISLGRPRNPITTEMCILGILCGVPYEEVRRMHTVDYKKMRSCYDKLTRPTRPLSISAEAGTQEMNSEVSAGDSSNSLETPVGAEAN